MGGFMVMMMVVVATEKGNRGGVSSIEEMEVSRGEES